jgi:hypothetical protein
MGVDAARYAPALDPSVNPTLSKSKWEYHEIETAASKYCIVVSQLCPHYYIQKE